MQRRGFGGHKFELSAEGEESDFAKMCVPSMCKLSDVGSKGQGQPTALFGNCS